MNLFSNRLKKAEKVFFENALEALWLEDPLSLYYFTNFEASSGVLLIFKTGEAIFFVDGRYIEEAKKNSKIKVEPQKNLPGILKRKKISKIGFDGAELTYDRKKALEKFFEKEKFLKKIKISPLRSLSRSFRLTKDELEIKKMQRAAKITEEGFLHIQKLLIPGVTEKEIAWEFEKFCRQDKNAEGLSFSPIIAFGENTACPHHKPGETRYKKGDPVLCDLGVKMHGYCSDFTRMWLPVKNHPLKKWYDVVTQAKKAALKKCKPGITIKEVDAAAKKVIQKAKLEKYILHGLGHGVGLEIHEPPRVRGDGEDKDLKLEANMVITIEPGLYKEKFGGVRNEDMILITKKGYKNFYTKQ